jgi:hypothetical protein
MAVKKIAAQMKSQPLNSGVQKIKSSWLLVNKL